MNGEQRAIALLIDGDNAQPKLIDGVLAESAKYGEITTRRIYGDWTTPQMSSWKGCLHSYAIQPIQQFRYTTGKNATDSALIIDAMDLLHQGTVGGFCIVSSDSDYTRLAMRIREQGLFVMGIGRSDTPKAFTNACQVFVHTENLSIKDDSKNKSAEWTLPTWGAEAARAVEMAAQEDGWAFLGAVGNNLRKLDPTFDVRSYGYNQLSALFRACPALFDMRESGSGQGSSQVYVRLKS